MMQRLKNIGNHYLNLKIVSSLGQAKQKNAENEIGFYAPVLVKLVEFLIVVLFIPLFIVVAGKILLYLAQTMDPGFLKENDSPGLFANIFLAGISSYIISIAIYGNHLFTKIATNVTIIKHQKYIYLKSSLGTLIATPVQNIKVTIENSILQIEFENDVEVWLDLNSVEDKNFQAEFLRCLGVSEL